MNNNRKMTVQQKINLIITFALVIILTKIINSGGFIL